MSWFSDCGLHKYDIVFGVPISSLVTTQYFGFLKLMLRSYIWRAHMEVLHAKVGVFAYNSMVKSNMLVNLNDFSSREGLLNRVLNWTYEGSSVPASVWQALNQIETMFRGNQSRPDKPDIAFLVVDNSSDWTGAVDKAAQLRNLYIQLFVIAVGFTDLSVPKSIAYNQSEVYVQSVNGYAELAGSDVPFTSFRADKCSEYLLVCRSKFAFV